MHALEKLVGDLVRLTPDAIPPRVRHLARLQVLGMLGATYAGRVSDVAEALVREGRRLGSGDRHDAWSFASHEKVAAHVALFTNSALAGCHDFDDYVLFGHVGLSSVHAALACGAEAGLTFAESLDLVVAANELMGRLGGSVLLGPQNGQLWTFIHAAGAAFVAARAMGLDVDRTAHAVAIALYQPPMAVWPGFVSDAKALSAAGPSLLGVSAARLAADGLRGSLGVLEHPQGFWSRFAFVPLPGLLEGVGESFVTETLSIKPVPGCAYATPVWQATRDALSVYTDANRGASLDWRAVESVDVDAQALTVGMEKLLGHSAFEDGLLQPVAANFSVPATVALTIVHGRLDPADLTADRRRAAAEALRAVARRTRVSHDPGATQRLVAEVVAHTGLRAEITSVSPGKLSRGLVALARHLGTNVAWDALVPMADNKRHLLGGISTIGGVARGLRTGTVARWSRARFEDFSFAFGVRVRIHTDDGATYVGEVERPLGASGADVDELESVATEKFAGQAGRFVDRAHAVSLAETVRSGALDDAPAAALGQSLHDAPPPS